MTKLLIPRDLLGGSVFTDIGYVVLSKDMSEEQTEAVAQVNPSWVVETPAAVSEVVEPQNAKQNGSKASKGQPAIVADSAAESAG